MESNENKLYPTKLVILAAAFPKYSLGSVDGLDDQHDQDDLDRDLSPMCEIDLSNETRFTRGRVPKHRRRNVVVCRTDARAGPMASLESLALVNSACSLWSVVAEVRHACQRRPPSVC